MMCLAILGMIFLFSNEVNVYAADVSPGTSVYGVPVVSENTIQDIEVIDESTVLDSEEVGQLVYLCEQLVDGLQINTSIMVKLIFVLCCLNAFCVGVLITIGIFLVFFR